MKLFCIVFGHRGYGIRLVDRGVVTCFCSRCGDAFEYTEAHFFDNNTKVFIPKGAIDPDDFRKAWERSYDVLS